MDRRSYLGSLAGAGSIGLAGCLGDIAIFDDSETALGPPEHDFSEAVHPAYGQEFPSFAIPDPLSGEEVSFDDLVDDRSFLMTFIFTSCTDNCGVLVNNLQLVQEDAADRGYEDDIALLAMTFDPETDDTDALRNYGEQHGVDLEADNWHFLRPETQEKALSLVNETFGAEAKLQPPEEGDHYDDGNGDNESDVAGDHNETDQGDYNETERTNESAQHTETDHDNQEGHEDDSHDDDGDHGSYHYYMIFLVNDQGIVERSYPRAPTETTPAEIIDDVRTVVE